MPFAEHKPPREDDAPMRDDESLTLRMPRRAVALVAAMVVHAGVMFAIDRMPEPKPVEKRIEVTITSSPPPSAPQVAPPAPRVPAPVKERRVAKKSVAPPPTSPVVPELPPSQREDVARLPDVDKSPVPAAPSTWQDRLSQQLAMTRPTAPKMPSGVLAPSLAQLDRVVMSDASLHDEQTERRLMQDHGQFFRRGLEALRSNWHPDVVLRETERSRDPTRKCGQRDRTTFAVAILDKQGRVVDVDLKSDSGCADLDQEAVSAFLRVAHFPHPPAGIFVAPDGSPTETARYPVRFIVTFDGGLRLDWNG
jgi:outer membrane biosynthesis protein TonB